MFFKQVRRNAAGHRKNNGLLFGSLVIAIVAFYTLLSLDSQDVMRFLETMESDAISRLMMLIPFIYIMSLFFVFFLVYFAYRYQMENRRKELGLYLMLGMKKSRLFALLMSETFLNSLVSVVIGLPIALLLTEGISLATAKLVGLGIIGHKISFSAMALVGTVAGFILVQMAAELLLCSEFIRREPMELLRYDAEEKQMAVSAKKAWRSFIIGIFLLLAAYAAGVFLLKSFNMIAVGLIFILGSVGTFKLYKGMGVFIGRRIAKKSPDQSGLFTFTGRQIQENVLHEHRALAVSSLLLLMAMACVSFGIGTAAGRGSSQVRSVDISIQGEEEQVRRVLESDEVKSMISAWYPMDISSMGQEHICSTAGLIEALNRQPASGLRDNMIENMDGRLEHVLSESSFNQLLTSMGREPIHLEGNQMAVYASDRDSREFSDILNGALKSGAYVELDGVHYDLLPQLYQDNVVADRQITLYIAYVVPDAVYAKTASHPDQPFCWNVVLEPGVVKDMGLMQALLAVQDKLSGSGLVFETFLSGIGRNLFYTVAASYITIYLGILFMIIANTVIGLKYLMQQRVSRKRYTTLLMLGAGKRALCGSARKQIRLFFGMVLGVSAVSSVFAIGSMFTSFLKLPSETSSVMVFLLAGVAFLLLVVIEFIYITIVMRASRKEIQALRVADRR